MSRIKKCILSLLIGLGVVISGCDECRNDDCPPNARFLFQVEDSIGNSIVGPAKLARPFESDEIRINGLDNVGNKQEVRLWINGTTLRFNLLNSFSKYIINYSTAKDDTLNFNTEARSDDCCMNIITDYQVKLNSNGNLVSSSLDSVFVFIK